MRGKGFVVPTMIMLAALALLAAAEKPGDEKALLDNLDLFTDVVTMINEDYYRDVEPEDLMEGAVAGMMASLDRYSYIEEREGDSGSADIGLELAIVDNILTVVAPVEGGPAARAGVIHGDRIIKINGDHLVNATLGDVRRMLRGGPGTRVGLTIYREGEKATRDLDLERAEVALPGLVESTVYDGSVACVRLASLPPGSGGEFAVEVEELLKRGVEGLVIDLRDDPGGDIGEAAAVAGYLIGNGRTIASVKSRLEGERREIKAPAAPPPDVPVAVLVNSGTAGEAEVVAGALKESGRAIVIGSKTFGNGSLQRDILLDGDLSLRMTVGRYVVAGETSFDGEGIVPEVEIPVGLEEEALLQKMREGGDVDEKEMPADSQLERAVDLLKGIKILGGEAGA